jgi:hypothetical protein
MFSVVLPATKFVPRTVTFTEVPLAPMAGVILVSVGVGGNIVNWRGDEVPPAFEIVTSRGPKAASPSTVNTAVPVLTLVTNTLGGAFTPVPLIEIVGSNRFVPVSVTTKLLPRGLWTADAGVSFVNVGGNGITVNKAAEEDPPGVVIVAVCKPGTAFKPIAKSAVAVTESMTLTLLTAISVPSATVMGA